MEKKPWWQSRGVWGAVIALGATVADETGLVPPEQVAQAGTAVVQAGGILLGLWGRLKASKAIGS